MHSYADGPYMANVSLNFITQIPIIFLLQVHMKNYECSMIQHNNNMLNLPVGVDSANLRNGTHCAQVQLLFTRIFNFYTFVLYLCVLYFCFRCCRRRVVQLPRVPEREAVELRRAGLSLQFRTYRKPQQRLALFAWGGSCR